MWLTQLLRKITRGPDVGETFRDYIGCYLLGLENDGQAPQYLDAPTNADDLLQAVRTHLNTLAQEMTQAQHPDLPKVQALLAELPQRLQAHLASDMQQPFAQWSGQTWFIRKGVRQRRRVDGRYVE